MASPNHTTVNIASFDDYMEVVVLDDVGSIDMEVDPPEEQHMIMELQSCRSTMKVQMPTSGQQEFLGLPVESSRVNYSDYVYLVLDTNVLISHLKFLQELKDMAIKGIGRPVLIVPWVVIQELDSLKNANRSISSKASRAGKFINECLSDKHPRVRGQTVEEVNTEVQNLAIVNNDDRIMHCCLVYQHKIKFKAEHGVVILFSNDTLLLAKAKMNNLIACDRKSLLSELKQLSNSSTSVAPVSYAHTTEYQGKVDKALVMDHQMQLAEDCLRQAEMYSRDAFSVIVDYEMTQVYGNLCNDIMVRKPPWSLEDIAVMLDKHWVAVFRYVFTARLPGINFQDLIKWLVTHAKNKSLRPLECDVLKFIDNSLILIEQMRKKPEVWSRISVFVASLKVLKEKMQNPRSPTQSPLATPTPYSNPSNLFTNSLQPTPITNGQIVSSNGNETQQHPFFSHLSQSVAGFINQCPNLPIDKVQWMFQVIRESLLCGIITAQTAVTSMSLSRQAEVWLVDMLRLVEGLIMAIESVLTQGLFIPALRSLYDAVQAYFSSVLNVTCPLTITQLCDVCQMEAIPGILQEGLRFMMDGRIQLLHLLQQQAQASQTAHLLNNS